MSITENMQTSTLPSKTPPKQLPHRPVHRIRRGQKLDEVVSLSEQRLNRFTSTSSGGSASQSTFAPTSSSSSSSSGAASSSNHAGGDSPFQLQEYLAMLVRRDPHNVEAITALPTEADIESSGSSADKGKAKDELEDDGIFQNIDTDVWVYEQLRRLVLDLTTPWLTALQQECDKHARPQTCAAMNAGDWMYLCASHGEEKQCCAIDYMVHTLDGATSLLNSARHFPSRTYVPNTSLRHFGSIARRLSRIFVHAWCYHKDVFLACEAETSLYLRFFVLVETYDLTATDNLPPKPGHGSSASSSSLDDNASAYQVDEAAEFSRGTSTAPLFTLNGTTAKRERSGTAAMRSSLAHSLQQAPLLHTQPPPQIDSAASMQVDAVGLVPPPAPSPRATAILSRPDHEEGDDDAPAWSSLANQGVKAQEPKEDEDDDDDDDDDEEEEEANGAESDDRTQKIGQRTDDDDATISLRGVELPAGLAASNGAKEEHALSKASASESDDAKASEETTS
ncbi:conserved hypothetical protein [Sporisorium reilianum SRZ2]|uniref:Uncharacterized protein n=1 Tax=Sporisorium reilianum (strain SRZ2) TaxID=999809 RepID=E6ZKQ1_SPORE|nr:conserved hypothetical protein [Sporisorium reilianum SRZ2]